MLRIRLHELFNQFNKNFQLFSRIQNSVLRQNKLKQLEANFRKFQAQCVSINNSDLRKKKFNHFEEIFNEDQKVLNQKEPFIKILVQGLINSTLNEAVRLQKKVVQMQNLQISDLNLKKKQNPYRLRQQSFFFNQKKKEKIDMKQFID